MNDMNETLAEIQRRGAERIRARKQTRNRVIALCVPLVLCVTALLVMPEFGQPTYVSRPVETMIPVYVGLMIFWGIIGFPGTILLGALALGQGLCLLLSRRNAAIHDLLAGTVVADFGSQMIFESAEALVEYQKKLHAERAARQEY